MPGDGVHTGWLDGSHSSLSQVILRDGERVLYAGTDVTTRVGVDRVGFALRTGERVEAIRAPASLPGAPGRPGPRQAVSQPLGGEPWPCCTSAESSCGPGGRLREGTFPQSLAVVGAFVLVSVL